MHLRTLRGSVDNRQVNQIVGLYDAPAYVRRARHVQEALDRLAAQCRRQREEWLGMTRIRLGVLAAMVGDWARLRSLVADDEQVLVLRDLAASLRPRLRAPVAVTSSLRSLRRALLELCDSIAKFNTRWQAFVEKIDFTHVNELRAGYNRYYLLEKECAVRSTAVARQGFRKLDPLAAAELLTLFPLLPIPLLSRS